MGITEWWGHRRTKGLLSPYLDNRLDEAQTNSLELHLAKCTRCQEDLGTLRSTVTLLRALPHAAPSRAFSLPARPPLQSPPLATPGYLWGMRVATALASFAMLALVIGDLSGAFSREVASTKDYAIESAQGTAPMGDKETAIAEADESPPSLDAPARNELDGLESPAEAEAANIARELAADDSLPAPASEEVVPVTTLTIVMGGTLALMSIATLFATLRQRRSRTSP